MAEVKDAGSNPASAKSERHEIDRIKGLLREMVRDAERGKEGGFFSDKVLRKTGKDLLASIDAAVEQELAELTKGGEAR
jgi:hypothetical protein